MFAIIFFYYLQIQNGNVTPEIITDYIVAESIASNVDPQLVLNTAKFESRLNPKAIGDNNTSFGLYQIHLPAHRDISREQAENIIWSTNWTIREIKQNGCRIWSTCKDTMKQLSVRDD